MTTETLRAGQECITQGDTNANNFYIVKSGLFEVFVDGKKMARLTTGTIFGELALIFGSARSATVTAAADSEGACVPLPPLV